MAAASAPTMHQLAKRAHEHNWAYREPGVVLVFCIVFVGMVPSLAVGVISVFIYRLYNKQKERKAAAFNRA
ncbi:hypothetical protein CDD80_515 [Ophiocordyceps camponoti-rufipedis]|uniref:Uncharacterized protein n=1 Tax=Ophiocordyceps camponoti-rufipedis TaxID=2004952 RepID=A0A2C5YHJ0_9HYPO|nr:hypothetical protein CDD80_515 [Ophiocordyceps camponoti-rufipedis]